MQKGFTPILVLVGILVIGLVAGGGYYFLKLKTPEPKACTMEAKLCPDGSSVGRSGPNCEFAPCPKFSQTPSEIKTETPKFEPGKVIVKFKPGISVNSGALPSQATNSETINQLLEKIKAEEIKSLYYGEKPPLYGSDSAAKDTNLERYYIVRFNPKLDAEQIASEFQTDPGVENASVNHYTRILQ